MLTSTLKKQPSRPFTLNYKPIVVGSNSIKTPGHTVNRTAKKTQSGAIQVGKTQLQKPMFLATSRLNRGQRKYCHCLMQVRTLKKIKPYAICKNMSYVIMQANRGQPAFRFKPSDTNCIMNYDYSQYTLQDVRAIARESGIPTHNPKTGKPNNKTTLVQLLTNRYISNHRARKQNAT